MVVWGKALAAGWTVRVKELGGEFLRVPLAKVVVSGEHDEAAPGRAETVPGASAVAETLNFAGRERNEPFQWKVDRCCVG